MVIPFPKMLLNRQEKLLCPHAQARNADVEIVPLLVAQNHEFINLYHNLILPQPLTLRPSEHTFGGRTWQR
jgi:hypothetical protein